jgi:AcrR family transcriptional regulator
VPGPETRERLQRAALATLSEDGIAGLSARGVARRAEVNQALIFYHYGSLFELLEQAATASVADAIDRYHEQFENADTFSGLLAVGRRLHEQERAAGNVAVMAQLTAGAHLDPRLAAAAQRCLRLWTDTIEPVVRRLVEQTPFEGLIDHRGLAHAVAAGFIGVELYDGVDREAAQLALDSLEQLGDVLEAVNGLGSVTRRAVRAHLQRRINPQGGRR